MGIGIWDWEGMGWEWELHCNFHYSENYNMYIYSMYENKILRKRRDIYDLCIVCICMYVYAR